MRRSIVTALLLLVTTLLLLGGKRLFAQNTPPVKFAEAQELNAGAFHGVATLTLDKSTIKMGEKYTVDIRFFNSSGGDYFYNPFFTGLIPLPAQLAIYDSDKEYIGDLLAWSGGSLRALSSHDWTFIPSDSYVGTKLLPFTAGYVPPNGQRKIHAGDYYLQMIYYKVFISAVRPAGGKELPASFYKNFDHVELFRSNAVKIHFTQ